jgi:hypothetical protein
MEMRHEDRLFADAELLHRSFGLGRRFRGDASGSPHILQSVRDRRSVCRDFPGLDGFPGFDGLLLSLPRSRSRLPYLRLARIKTLIAALTSPRSLQYRAVAKAEKTRATHVEPDNSVTCGRLVLSDSDLGSGAGFPRGCANYDGRQLTARSMDL